jgi:DNA-binding MarR family transcriptional regulator
MPPGDAAPPPPPYASGEAGHGEQSLAPEELLRVAAALERARGWLRRSAPPIEWGLPALGALMALDSCGPLRITDLVARERISQPGMTGLVTRLADAGLVVRSDHPSDGRARLVAITDAGRAYLRQLQAQRAAGVAERLAMLAPAEQRALAAAVDALDTLARAPIAQEGS